MLALGSGVRPLDGQCGPVQSIGLRPIAALPVRVKGKKLMLAPRPEVLRKYLKRVELPKRVRTALVVAFPI